MKNLIFLNAGELSEPSQVLIQQMYQQLCSNVKKQFHYDFYDHRCIKIKFFSKIFVTTVWLRMSIHLKVKG